MLNGRELKKKYGRCHCQLDCNGIGGPPGGGIVPVRSVRENISLAFIRQFKRQAKSLIKRGEKAVNNMIDTFNIKVSNPEQEIRTLSGGNQQKAILAKWLLGDIKVLILDEPTRGIDVGSKAEDS